MPELGPTTNSNSDQVSTRSIVLTRTVDIRKSVQQAIFSLKMSARLFRFPKPEWLNSQNARTAGVYLAGALVRAFPLLTFSRALQAKELPHLQWIYKQNP
jgi:hypothetical protein